MSRAQSCLVARWLFLSISRYVATISRPVSVRVAPPPLRPPRVASTSGWLKHRVVYLTRFHARM
ncbi:hypothetical protein SBV1_1440009 [Verrucomicrobia bacterium]|nr:hypothetical protein SBV1_1440009 [Verrucomicrobiota bacterium]